MDRQRVLTEHPQGKGRRISDDVTSLDSWSELNDRESKSDGHEHSPSPRGRELLLSPSRLSAIEEPPEPKLTRVTLMKSEPSQTGFHSRHKLFRMPDTSDRTDDRGGSHHSRMKKPWKKHQHRSVDNLVEDNTERTANNRFSASDRTPSSVYSDFKQDACDCNDCQQSTSGENRQAIPHIFKQHRLPFPSRSLHKDSPVDGNDIEQSEKVKNKLMSVWNNVKYGRHAYTGDIS